ncbi:MAG: hypothetical protein Kow0090_10420 [Myxococcota bacterium]
MEIIEAAERVFAGKGYYNARMEDIAREAAYAPASLYSYFKSKEEIFTSILEVRFSELLERLESDKTAEADFPDNLRHVVDEFTKFGRQYRHFLRILFSLHITGEAPKRDNAFICESLEVFDFYIGILERTVAKGIAQGKVKTTDANHLAFLLHGMMIGTFAKHIIKNDEEGLSEGELFRYKETILEVFLKGAMKNGA